MNRPYANTATLHIKDLNIHGFGISGCPGTNPPQILKDTCTGMCGFHILELK